MPEDRSINNTNTTEDPFKVVDELLNELKKLGSENKETIHEENKYTTVTSETNSQKPSETTNLEQLENEIKKLEEDIKKTNEYQFQLNDGRIVDLNTIPRREWRNYNNKGKLLSEIKQNELRALKRRLLELKRTQPQMTSTQELPMKHIRIRPTLTNTENVSKENNIETNNRLERKHHTISKETEDIISTVKQPDLQESEKSRNKDLNDNFEELSLDVKNTNTKTTTKKNDDLELELDLDTLELNLDLESNNIKKEKKK